jgi:DNA-binding MarR family transcriptional regulator
MRHKVIIMRDPSLRPGHEVRSRVNSGEPMGGGERSEVGKGNIRPQEAREGREQALGALEEASSLIASVAPRFFRLVKARMVRDLDTPDDIRELGESQMWVLHSLTGEPKGRHQNSELARHYNVTDPTMSRIIDALVRKGYVERRPDIRDRRCIFLEITEQGTDLARYINERFHRAIVQFLSPLTEEQLNDILKAYKHLGSLLPDTSQEQERELDELEAIEEGAGRHRGHRDRGPWHHTRQRSPRNHQQGHGWHG